MEFAHATFIINCYIIYFMLTLILSQFFKHYDQTFCVCSLWGFNTFHLLLQSKYPKWVFFFSLNVQPHDMERIFIWGKKSVTITIMIFGLFAHIVSNLTDQLLQERHWVGVKEDRQFSLLCVQHDAKVKSILFIFLVYGYSTCNEPLLWLVDDP